MCIYVCVWAGRGLVQAGWHAQELMPQIVVRCRSPSAMRFGQESNVIGFVQSSWQPTPPDICSLLTTQTYLHQGTHTNTGTEPTRAAQNRQTLTHISP